MLSILLLAGCAAQTSLTPLGRGNTTANLSVGGPMLTAFSNKIPVPYTVLGINYGMSERANVTGNLHIFPLAYKIAGLDLGLSYFPVENEGWKPTFGVQQKIMIFGSLKSSVASRFRFYPITSPTFAWKQKHGLFYTGFDLVPLLFNADYDNQPPRIVFSPFIGHRWQVWKRTGLQLELKWHGYNIRSDEMAVDYQTFGNRGALTPFISFDRRF
ncbi:hypothetical protein ACFLQV_02970 [Calditrichota bacterium]